MPTCNLRVYLEAYQFSLFQIRSDMCVNLLFHNMYVFHAPLTFYLKMWKNNSRCKLLDTEHWVSELEKFYCSFGCTSSFYRLQIWAGDRVENISKVSWLVWEQNLIWSQNWDSFAISNLSSPQVKLFAWLLDCTIWGNKYAYKIIWIDLVWMNHKEVRKN